MQVESPGRESYSHFPRCGEVRIEGHSWRWKHTEHVWKAGRSDVARVLWPREEDLAPKEWWLERLAFCQGLLTGLSASILLLPRCYWRDLSEP